MSIRQAIANALAHGVILVVRAYVRLSPLQYGKSRMRTKAAILISRIAVLEDRQMSVSVSGVTLPMWLSPSSIVGATVMFFGNFEVNDVDACMRVLAQRRKAVLLDIGANCGLYSLFGAAGSPQVRVIAVEADPAVAGWLRRNVAENAPAFARQKSAIEVVEAALGATDGQARFIRSWDSGFGSLCAVSGRERETITVPVRRGDDLLAELAIDEVDFCKLDVEGGEMLVLRGLSETLRRGRIRVLQVEMNQQLSRRAGHSCDALVALLAGHGYEMTTESQLRYEAGGWDCENFYFVGADFKSGTFRLGV